MRRPVGGRFLLVGSLVGLASLVGGAACQGRMAKIERLRDALATDDATAVARVTEGFAPCPEEAPKALAAADPGPYDRKCLTEIADALGSRKGFQPVDQAAAATAALVLSRDRRGDVLAHADAWLAAMKGNRGAGADALRLATSRRMAEAAALVGRDIQEERDARATLAAIAASIPGACPTYRLVGGEDAGEASARAIPAELTPEHSACVQKDLMRREGKGARYGAGTFRALEGALALWREAERALRIGVTVAGPGSKDALERRLAVIEAATQKNATKRVELAPAPEVIEMLGELHADAGIRMEPDAVDAGAPVQRAPLR